MALEDLCNTGLVLTLGSSLTNSVKTSLDHHENQDQQLFCHKYDLPSLALGLSTTSSSSSSSDRRHKIGGSSDSRTLYRQPSSVSAMSCVSVKREQREEELDDDQRSVRKKLRLKKEQYMVLEETFKLHSTLNPEQKQVLARKLNLRPRQVEVWFQNRRARTKLKQTEMESEFLKKCCETLTEENRRLQKELQELKALPVAPIYMQLPATALSICPSCGKNGGSGSGENFSRSSS